MKLYLKFITSGLFLVASGCASVNTDYHQLGYNLAAGADLLNTVIRTPAFDFTTFVRIKNHDRPIRIYIEGDGFAWVKRNQRATDPTPHQAIGLQLASQDYYPNIIYIARPCQYRQTTKVCDSRYWTMHRFSLEVVQAMNDVINQLNTAQQALEIVGYSGGANIALLIASQRHDVINIRTVAGNLDHDFVNRYHGVDLMPKSLNAIDVAYSLRHIPQLHFIGLQDPVIPQGLAVHYLKKAKLLKCHEQHALVSAVEAEHQKGWAVLWPSLINKPIPICRLSP